MILVPIKTSEAQYKLCRVMKAQLGRGGVPYITTHDGRTVRFPDPDIKVGDSIKFSLKTKEIMDFHKLEIGARIMVTKGRNTGRIGNIRKIEKHPGSHNIAHIEDVRGLHFATRITNVFVIGKGSDSAITLPEGAGVKLSVIEERNNRAQRQANRM